MSICQPIGVTNKYADGDSCEGFVKAVIGTLSGEFKEDCPEEEIRVCLSGYMAWISKRQKRGDDNGVDREKSSRNVKSRSKQVSAISISFLPMTNNTLQLAVALVVGLDTSLVNLCREREMLKAAVRSNALGFTLWAQDDEHGLPKDLGSSLDDSFVPFDTFQVLRDRFIEKKGDHGDAFAGRDVTWWSPKVSIDTYHSGSIVLPTKLIFDCNSFAWRFGSCTRRHDLFRPRGLDCLCFIFPFLTIHLCQ